MARKLPKVPPPLKTNRLEVRYGADITTMLAPFKELVERELFPMLDYITQAQPVKLDAAGMPPACSKHAPGMPPAWREDAAGDDIRKIFEKIKLQYERSFSPKIISRIAQETAGKVESQNHKSFRKQTKTVLGVDPVFAEPWLAEETESFVHENASLIKSIPQEHLADIEQMVFRESRRGSSPAEIKAKVAELFKTTDNAAALIARDQVAKFNGRLSQLRQTAAGITHYIWRTAEDGRVRTLANSSGYSSHAALDGKTFSWDDPPATVFKGKRAGERNHPGQDIQCRCYAEPVFVKVEKKAKAVEPEAPAAFKPHATISEARESIQQKGAKLSTLSGVNLGQANLISKSLSKIPKAAIPDYIGNSKDYATMTGRKLGRRVKDFYGVHNSGDFWTFPIEMKDVEGYTTRETMGGTVRVKEHTHGVWLSNGYKEADKITERKLAINEYYQKKEGLDWFFNATGETVPLHEFGHVFYDRKRLGSKWEAIGKRWYSETRIGSLSTPAESFAEAFAEHFHNEGKRLPDYVKEFIKKEVV